MVNIDMILNQWNTLNTLPSPAIYGMALGELLGIFWRNLTFLHQAYSNQ